MEKLRQRISQLDNDIKQPQKYKDFYQFAFNFAKDTGSKNLSELKFRIPWQFKRITGGSSHSYWTASPWRSTPLCPSFLFWHAFARFLYKNFTEYPKICIFLMEFSKVTHKDGIFLGKFTKGAHKVVPFSWNFHKVSITFQFVSCLFFIFDARFLIFLGFGSYKSLNQAHLSISHWKSWIGRKQWWAKNCIAKVKTLLWNFLQG